MLSIKDAVRELIDQLPDECTWDDVMYRIYVRQKIEAGLADSAAGRVHSNEDIRREFEEALREGSAVD